MYLLGVPERSAQALNSLKDCNDIYVQLLSRAILFALQPCIWILESPLTSRSRQVFVILLLSATFIRCSCM